MEQVTALDFQRHEDEIKESWQAKALRSATGTMSMVVMSVLAHNYDAAMQVLLLVTGRQVRAPFLTSAGKIAKNGVVMADLIGKYGRQERNVGLFLSTDTMEGAFRRFADSLKLDDADREQMFIALRNWVVCDYRLDPTMDPADPDARRLTVN